LGLAYIASSLRSAGHEVILLDGKLANLSEKQIVDYSILSKPDLIGITCMTVEFPVSATIACAIKEKIQTPIVIGGAHVNASREELSKNVRLLIMPAQAKASI